MVKVSRHPESDKSNGAQFHELAWMAADSRQVRVTIRLFGFTEFLYFPGLIQAVIRMILYVAEVLEV